MKPGLVFEKAGARSALIAGVDYDHALEIDLRNDWREGNELNAEEMLEVVSCAAGVLHSMMIFCIDKKPIDSLAAMERVCARFYSFVHRYFPELLKSKSGSLLSRSQIAAQIPNYTDSRLYAQAYYFKVSWESLNAAMKAQAMVGLEAYISFCIRVEFDESKLHIGVLRGLRRFISLVWLLRPGLLFDSNGDELSLERLSKLLGCSRCWLSTIAEDFSIIWSCHSRVQKSKSSRPNYAAATKRAWVERRAKSNA
jgi:hypothetical protein